MKNWCNFLHLRLWINSLYCVVLKIIIIRIYFTYFMNINQDLRNLFKKTAYCNNSIGTKLKKKKVIALIWFWKIALSMRFDRCLLLPHFCILKLFKLHTFFCILSQSGKQYIIVHFNYNRLKYSHSENSHCKSMIILLKNPH